MSTKPTPGAARGRRTPAPATPTDGPDMTLAYAAHAQAATEPIKATSIRLPERLHKHLRRHSVEAGVPMSQLIIQAIEAQHPEQ
ncbi:hypothetical protein CIK52_17820 [Kocuria rosea]|uniref:Uncharacterized protein n=1 Tax=Kocuria oceani TaxID=988827 RepID=A0ABV9TGW2_9MICC|nr:MULTISPECIES: hypothetical protein [Kocuria]MUK03636.1 hypothetical protein [Vibrio cholerae]MEB2529341.1 hypothetical protein [Kocuria rosea]MEB2620470.1 hypothetical protein [Kocuria rosea]PWF79355.1 hypothetical protein DEJ38_18365 [Kocuria rosea]PWF81278.1 hypothetical protein CIK52_17820 [Kocuria rosea]